MADENTVEKFPKGLKEAPLIYADGFKGVVSYGGVIRMNFFVNVILDGASEIEHKASVILALPLSDAEAIGLAIADIAKTFKNQGQES